MADVEITVGFRDLGVVRGFDRVEKRISRSSKTLGIFRQGLRGLAGGAGFAAVTGIARGFAAISRTVEVAADKFINMRRGLEEANRILGLTQGRLKSLEPILTDISISTGQNIDGLTESFEGFASAQFNVEQILKRVRIAARAATGDFAKAEKLTLGLIAGEKIFLARPGRVADVISQTVVQAVFARGVGSEQVAQFLRRAGLEFRAAGASIEKATAVFATIAQAGLPAPEAITVAKRFALEIITQKFQDRFVKILTEAGVKVTAEQVDVTRPEVDILDLVPLLRQLTDKQIERAFTRKPAFKAALELKAPESTERQELKTIFNEILKATKGIGAVERRFQLREEGITLEIEQSRQRSEAALRALGGEVGLEFIGIRTALTIALVKNKDSIIKFGKAIVVVTALLGKLAGFFFTDIFERPSRGARGARAEAGRRRIDEFFRSGEAARTLKRRQRGDPIGGALGELLERRSLIMSQRKKSLAEGSLPADDFKPVIEQLEAVCNDITKQTEVMEEANTVSKNQGDDAAIKQERLIVGVSR